MQVEEVIGRCQKRIISIIAYSRNRSKPKSQDYEFIFSCKVNK